MSNTAANADPVVLIIGAGPTGAVAAKRFVEAGMRVVVLEQGDWPDYSKARAHHPDFELTMGRYWSGNPNRRQAAADYPIDDSDSDISAVLYNGVGGGTVIYAAHWQRNIAQLLPLPPIDSSPSHLTLRGEGCWGRDTDDVWIFACARSTAWATTGRSLTKTSRRFTSASLSATTLFTIKWREV